MENDKGEKIFLGFPNQNKRTAGQQYEEHCILDRICSKLNKIPPQFVLGYYYETQKGSKSFIKNEQHYSNLNKEQREAFFTECSSNMDDISKNYNNLIANGNFEQLSKIKEKIQQLGWNSDMVDNAITLAQKYKEEIRAKNPRIRQVIIDRDKQNDNQSNQVVQTKSQRRRKILLDACTETKLSDISTAKKILKEGLEKQEKEYKGEEL